MAATTSANQRRAVQTTSASGNSVRQFKANLRVVESRGDDEREPAARSANHSRFRQFKANLRMVVSRGGEECEPLHFQAIQGKVSLILFQLGSYS